MTMPEEKFLLGAANVLPSQPRTCAMHKSGDEYTDRLIGAFAVL